MIDILVAYFNTRINSLSYFSKQFELCEIIREDGKDGFMSFPAEYQGKGEHKNVSDFDLSDGVTYWRKNGNISESVSDVDLGACVDVFERTIPLKLIGVKSKELSDTAYLADDIVEDIRGVIAGKAVIALKDLMNAFSVDVNFVSSNTDALSVYEGEYTNVDGQMDYDHAYFSIDLEVVITGTKDCFETICDVTVSSFLCQMISASAPADIDACLIAAGKKDAVCGAFVDVDIFHSDGTGLVASKGSGETFDIPKHDIILPDGITNLESKEFDEDTNLVRAYNKVALTCQTTIRGTGDDGWHNVNGTYTYNTLGIRPILDPNDETKLANISGNENAFGNFERFTDDSGGSGWVADQYMIDHYTGYAVTHSLSNASTSWNNQIDWADGLSHNGFSDYRVPNTNEICTWINWVASRWFNFIGFSTGSRFATSTSESATLHYGAHNGNRNIDGVSGNMLAFAIRDHYS